MRTKLERDVYILKAYALAITLLLAVLAFSAFTAQNRKPKFEEIDVERINVVEKDGKLKLVISDTERLPDGIEAGKIVPRNGKSPGILFFNDEGDECGGLLFDGRRRDGKIAAGGSLTFDQYQQDQTLQLTYSDYNDYRLVGLRIKDRPDIPQPEQARRLEEVSKMKDGPDKKLAMKPLLAPDRVFVGKTSGNAGVWLFDANGKPRITMSVGASGNPKLVFLDGDGKAIYSLPESSAGKVDH